MPSRSRRNRRNMPQSRPGISQPDVSPPVSSGTTAPPSRHVYQARTTRATTVAAPTYPYILQEIKWIALVTVIIVAILIVLYFLFR